LFQSYLACSIGNGVNEDEGNRAFTYN